MSFEVLLKDGRAFTWWINSQPMYLPFKMTPENIHCLIADGDELQTVVSHIRNLPHTTPRCKWRGGLAWFVYENLPWDANAPADPAQDTPVPP
jgi:hypothetical protein